jgi:hypothetical protein
LHPWSPFRTDSLTRRMGQAAVPPRKRNAVVWGAAIGGGAGLIGGFVQPTHSNGEYVFGTSRGGSALALGAACAGVGALIGLGIDRLRQ